MKILKALSSLISLCAVIVYLGAILVGAGCTAMEPGSVAQDEAEISSALMSTPEAVAEEPSNPEAAVVCPPDPGRPVPGNKEEAFVTCVGACVSSGNPHGGCWSGCCRTYTGCSVCYIQ